MANNTIAENIRQAIDDFDSIKDALINKGVNIENIPTSQYSLKIDEIETGISLKLFIQSTQPEGYKGIWINSDTYSYENIVEVPDADSLIPNSINFIKGYNYETILFYSSNLDELTYTFKRILLTDENNSLIYGTKIYYGNGQKWVDISYNSLIEYIKGTGTQWIDTLVKPKTTTKIILKVNAPTPSSEKELFGTYSNSTNDRFMLARWSEGVLNLYHTSSNNISYSAGESRTEFIITVGQNIFKVEDFNGNVLHNVSIGNGGNGQYNIPLFGRRNGSTTVSNIMPMSLYYCQIYEGTTLVRDFQPAKDNNGVVCLYDTVSGTYFYNKGTGNFTTE